MMDGATSARGTPQQSELVALIPALRAFARTFHRHPSDADDLVQQTLMKAVASIDQYRPGTRMKSWLFTIMRNTFYTNVKLARREQVGADGCVSEQPSLPDTQAWSMRGREIAEAIQQLPEQQREVIILVGVLGVSYEEATEICGCAIGTIKSRMNRARARLMELLGDDQPALPAPEEEENEPVRLRRAR